MQTASKKVVNGWAMYDWANSAYNLVITSTIFPAYYDAITTTKDAAGKVLSHKITFLGLQFENASLYNYALATAYLIIALISPILSSIADYKGNKKSFMQFFCYLGSVSCMLMYFFTKDTLSLGIFTCIIAAVGYCGSFVFYNSYLPEIASEEDRDRVSAKGFAWGYTGSIILQIFCFVLVLAPLFKDATVAPRISFLLQAYGGLGLHKLPLTVYRRVRPLQVLKTGTY